MADAIKHTPAVTRAQRRRMTETVVDAAQKRGTPARKAPASSSRPKAAASSFAPRNTGKREFGAPISTPLFNRQTTDSNN